MGQVWLARHVELGLAVAIKTPLCALTPRAAARFKTEACATAALRSQHIVRIYDYGLDDGIAYIAMELLEGETLRDKLSQGRRLSVEETSLVARHVARALSAAHERQIVHRDIKPSNLFLSVLDGEKVVKVLDFGIAQMGSDDPLQSTVSAKAIIGSPGYLSPEQVYGDTIGPHADLWSLGAVLFRALTGVEPFRSASPGEVMEKIRTANLPRASTLVPDLGTEFDAFFARAMQREPHRRFESAERLADAFERIAARYASHTDGGWLDATEERVAEIAIHGDGHSLVPVAPPEQTRYGRLYGLSISMRRLFAVLGRLEGSLVNVLIEGESGTGKEVVARAIHEHSAVARGPFVAVNCGALDRNLVRSELFGHRRGAFTTAVEGRLGAFELANGGTLFLDEIGELPLDVQPVLLRALESETVVRVGESIERPVKVRVIAATNRDLTVDVGERRFREDLFYRLVVVKLRIPPLRERTEDIVALAEHFATELDIGRLSPELLTQLCAHPWRGNVRELKNTLKAYSAIGAMPSAAANDGGALESVLRGAIDVAKPYSDRKQEVVEAFRRVYFQKLLEHTSGNQSEAARLSGLERSYLNKIVNKMGLRR